MDVPELFASLTMAAEDLAGLAAEGMSRDMPCVLQKELYATADQRVRGLSAIVALIGLEFL